MTVARAVENLLPDIPICYLGDLARTPYGPKSESAIIEYSLENSEFLLQQGAKMIVIACNSASSVATQTLRQKFSVPIIEVISPAVNEAMVSTTTGRIGVIGTSATIRSEIYPRQLTAINEQFAVFSQPCPLLVPLVEEGWLNKQETKMIIRRYLSPLKHKQIDTLVLGCTHYPLLKHLIQPRIGKKVMLIDSSEAVAKYLKKFLHDHPGMITPNGGTHRYFVTDLTETAAKTVQKIFQRTIELIPV